MVEFIMEFESEFMIKFPYDDTKKIIIADYAEKYFRNKLI